MAKMREARRRMWRARVFFESPRARRDCREKMMDAPTRKRKLGKTKSGRGKPFQGAWSGLVCVGAQSPGSLTRIMRAMVRPRRTSMERTRAGAATVTEGWAIGAAAAGAPEIAGLGAGLAAGAIVIHDRSARTGVGEFGGWTVVEKRISPLRRLQRRERLRSK